MPMLLLYHTSIKMLSWSLISFSFIESLSKTLFISCILALSGMIPLFQSACVLRLNLVMERLHWIWRKAILLLRTKKRRLSSAFQKDVSDSPMAEMSAMLLSHYYCILWLKRRTTNMYGVEDHITDWP